MASGMTNTPKPQRVMQLSMVGGSGTFKTPPKRRSYVSFAASPSIVESPINDDEAERRNSRRFENSMSENESGVNLSEAADSLTNCLKLFTENKINKDNAWNINIIDSFSKLLHKHHHAISNFQVAGTTLEASAKVYGLRVDSVYTDAVRMSANLARQSAKALTKKGTRNDDEEDEFEEQDSMAEREAPNADPNQPNEEPRPKPKKVRKYNAVSTVTKNPDTLNGRLETDPLTDPFFAKLNSVIGDTTSSKRLMQNIIPTEDSKLKLWQNSPFWNSNDQPEIDLDEEMDYQNPDPSHRILRVIPTFNLNITNAYVRQGLSTYILTKEPMEKYDDQENSFHTRFDDELNDTVFNRSIHTGLQFDVNAEVEPVAFDKSQVVMDFGEMDNDDFDDVEDVDQIAINRCKGLRRQPILIEDMQPENCAKLEYSYRPIDIDQFWAGPSYWKFRGSRRTAAMSIGTRASAHTVNSSVRASAAQRPKTVRKRANLLKTEATLDDLLRIDEDSAHVIVKSTAKTKGNQLTNQAIAKKWDAKKHKLPDDFKVAQDIFDKFVNAGSIHIDSNLDMTITGADDDDGGLGYDYDNSNDRDYCRQPDDQSDTETGTNTDMGQMDNLEFDNFDPQPQSAPVDEIPDVFVGAPERVEKINIGFAKRAKVIDMKQLKSCTWNLIDHKHQVDPEHNPTFAGTLKELPKVLSRPMAENLSVPLEFYAMLHLCNDKGLFLNPSVNGMKDFDIQFPAEE